MDPLSIISANLPPVRCLLAYSEQLQAIGGTPPYTWTLISGSFPTGVSLSVGGVLSAAVSAVPTDSVGDYAFRLEVEDATATKEGHDYTLSVVPSSYGRVPEFLLDTRFYGLVSRFLMDITTRRKTEMHFFRDIVAALGTTYVHLDRDILCPSWSGSDRSLRAALDLLKTASDAAVKTISGISPDGAGDFGLTSGLGVSLTPQPNGLRIDNTSIGEALDVRKAEGAVLPGGTLTLNLATAEFLAQAWVKVNGVYYKTGNIPDTVAKHLSVNVNNTRSSPGTALMAMCVGTDGAKPVMHTAGSFVPPGLTIARHDGLSLAHEETFLLSANPSAPYYEPLVLSGNDVGGNPKVVVLWVELNAGLDLMYAELDPADYTNAPVILPLTPLLAPATQVRPLGQDGAANVARLIGTFDFNGNVYVACEADPGVPLQQIIVEIQVGSGVPPVVSFAAPVFATPTTCLDMICDNMRGVLYWLVAAREAVPANGPLELYQVTTGPLAVSAPFTIDASAAHGFYYRAAGMCIDAGSGVPATDLMGIFAIRHMPAAPGTTPTEVLTRYTVSGLGNPFPAGMSLGLGGAVASVIGPVYQSRFAKDWDVNSTVRSRLAFVEPQIRQDGYSVRRSYLGVTGALGPAEQLVYFPLLNAWSHVPLAVDESYVWTRVAETQANVVNPTGYAGRVLISLEDKHCYSSLDPCLKDLITVDFDPVTYVLTGRNASPFTWDMAIHAVEETIVPYPPNLQVACWQLAQALQNYWNANGFYPSASCNPPGPGGVQGTVWDEFEAGNTNTGGVVLYPTYYTVLPGTWDLVGGGAAQAEYYSAGVPGASVDCWVVFRYNSLPASILAAETVIDAAVGAAVPASGVYTLAQLDAAMGFPGWPAMYGGAPYDRYQFFCFVDPNGGYRLGWFSMNYIHNAQVYGPAPTGGEFNIPFMETFMVAAPAVPGAPTTFTLSRASRAATLHVNGIEYYQGDDWAFGMTTDVIDYLNAPGGYTLNMGDKVVIRYFV